MYIYKHTAHTCRPVYGRAWPCNTHVKYALTPMAGATAMGMRATRDMSSVAIMEEMHVAAMRSTCT